MSEELVDGQETGEPIRKSEGMFVRIDVLGERTPDGTYPIALATAEGQSVDDTARLLLITAKTILENKYGGVDDER